MTVKADYIATAHSLIGLEGKLLQRKRSLIRQFRENCPGWRFEEITPRNIDAAFEVERLWQREGSDGNATAFVRRCFRYYQEQGLRGGILYNGQETLGYAMTADCGKRGGLILVLRVRPAPAGAAAMLYRQTALLLKTHLPELQWVNLGQVGSPTELRNRDSYHPQWIIQQQTN